MDIVSFLLGQKAGAAAGGSDLSEVNARLDAINGEMIGANTVTFVVDGKVYATVKVAPGDTAKAPANPTKASTAAEEFMFQGWSREDDGTVDSDALQNVTEDRIVYAVFAASPRYYTVTFYDDDGTKLKSESVVYGGSSTYTPEKKGALFQNWNPAPVNVSSDLDCYAVWEYVAFTNDDWATIKAVAQTHSAADHYAKGDTRELTLTYSDGSTETALLEVAEFNPGVELVDDDGNVAGTAGMTIRLKTALATPQPFLAESWSKGDEVSYLASRVFHYLHYTVIPAMPAELRAVLSAARQEYDYSTGTAYTTKTRTGDAKLWILTKDQANSMGRANLHKTVYGSETPVCWHLRTIVNAYGFPCGVIAGENVEAFVNDMLLDEEGAKTPDHIIFEFYL